MIKYFYEGKTLSQYCELNNIPYPSIKAIILRKKVSVEEALKHWKEVKSKKSMAQLAREAGISPIRVYIRKYNGFDEKDLYRPIMTKAEASKRHCEIYHQNSYIDIFDNKKQRVAMSKYMSKGYRIVQEFKESEK